MARRQWWAAAVCMGLALAVKPLALVLLVFAPAVYAPLRWRVPVVVAAFAALPILLAPADYALGQYRESLTNLRWCEDYGGTSLCRLQRHGPCFRGSIAAPFVVRTSSGRFADALSVLVLHAALGRTRPGHDPSCTGRGLFDAVQSHDGNQQLCNSRTGLAFWAVSPATAPRQYGWAVAGLALSMGLLPEMLRSISATRSRIFWYPAMTIVFAAIVVRVDWPSRQGARA